MPCTDTNELGICSLSRLIKPIEIINNVKETDPIRKKFRAGMEQAVPTDAGEEIQERRASPEKTEAGEILKAWDIKDRLNRDRRFAVARTHLRVTLGDFIYVVYREKRYSNISVTGVLFFMVFILVLGFLGLPIFYRAFFLRITPFIIPRCPGLT
jgi:hypothetical protein